MSAAATHAVTGAYGYSGRHIARRLLAQGHRVVTLTNSSHRRRPSEPGLPTFPLDFGAPDRLRAALEGVDVLHNTYWVRFNHRRFTHAEAVENTFTLFRAARDAGVRRVVHVSITNPNPTSPLEYFRGKARIETALRDSGLSYAILRPAVLFGEADILINNIAWFLRRCPVFGVLGDGRYRLQPIHVADFAELAVAAAERRGDEVVEAIGPETFTFAELATELSLALGLRRRIVRVPPLLGLGIARAAGLALGDVVLTREEIRGLMADLLYVDAPPAGTTRLTVWAREHRAELGRRYASELGRRRPRPGS